MKINKRLCYNLVMKTLYKIGKTAELLNLHPNTLRAMHADGSFVPAFVGRGGSRYYSYEQIQQFAGKDTAQTNDLPRKIIGYCRVSSTKQKADLERQKDRLELYMLAQGYQFETISDIGSSINFNNKGLLKLLAMVENNEVEKIVIMHKDRLLQFGFELFEQICHIHNTNIEIVAHTNLSDEQELVTDLVQLITAFNDKLQDKRTK